MTTQETLKEILIWIANEKLRAFEWSRSLAMEACLENNTVNRENTRVKAIEENSEFQTLRNVEAYVMGICDRENGIPKKETT